VLLNEIIPSSCLSEYIKTFRIIEFHFPDLTVIPFKAYPPRPEQCLQFMPKDPETVVYPVSGQTISGKKTIIMGLHTNVIHRYVARDFLGLQVIFQPGAFFMLTNISCNELVNVYIDAEDIFGTELQLVNEQLFHAKDYKEMILIVEIFLIRRIKKINDYKHRVDEVSRLMSFETDKFSVDKFLKAACLSHRQFDRKFKERVGLTPKYFLQMARFDKAFRMKNRFPLKNWLAVALHCGYYDYQHLVKDYKEFTGYTPPAFFAIDNKAPERLTGDAEV
jgi:AraC-like DNA-binding protein